MHANGNPRRIRIRFIIPMNRALMAKTADKRTTNANKHLIH